MATQVVNKVDLDLDGNYNKYVTIKAKQGDANSRKVVATIYNQGTKVELGSGMTVTISYKRSDQLTKAATGTINSDGTVEVPLIPWALELPYMLACDVSITEGSNKVTAFSFFVQIEPSAIVDSGDVVDYIDTTDATATAKDIVSGKTAYANGSKLTGTFAPQTQSVTPTTSSQTVTPDSGKYLSQVTVGAIPSTYVVPSGSLSVTSNGTYDVSKYASAVVNIESTTVTYANAEDISI